MRLLITTLICLLSWGIAQANTNRVVDPELREALKKAVLETKSFGDRYEAEVWFTDMSFRLRKKFPEPRKRMEFLKMVHAEARAAGLSPELVLSVIQVESNFDQWAISRVGARGLMQIMPFWLKEIGRPNDNLFHIRTNLRFGCTILKHYLNKENGNLIRALGRYNGSLGRLRYPSKVMAAMRDRWYRP